MQISLILEWKEWEQNSYKFVLEILTGNSVVYLQSKNIFK
jgi:hypothetical protein